MTYKIFKTDESWKEQLSPEQFRICRKKDTERPFTGIYNDCKEKGIMVQFYDGKEPIYKYAPLNLKETDFDKWYDNCMEENNNLTWIRNIYWKLNIFSCVLVPRNKKWFESHFPADFIVEYIGQTRGWFYTMMVLSTAIFDRPPFKNCICHGIVLDTEGVKLSKKLRNYPEPEMIWKTGYND